MPPPARSGPRRARRLRRPRRRRPPPAPTPAQPVVATVAAPTLPAVEIDWHRLALLGRGPVIEVPTLVGTLPAPPAIAAAIEAAIPPVTLAGTVTVTLPQVTTVTVPIPPGP